MVSRSNGRKRGPVRQERKKALFRMKNMVRVLNETFVGKQSSSSKRGKVHTLLVNPGGKKGKVEGFIDATPDPPKSKSRNSRASWPPTPGTLVSHERNRQRGPFTGCLCPLWFLFCPLTSFEGTRLRAGAPSRPPKRMTVTGKRGVFLSDKQYQRLVRARDQLHLQAREFKMHARKRDLNARRPLAQRIAVASLLQADGVSAAKLQHVMSVVLFYALGRVPEKLLFSSSTSLRYVRIMGAALKTRLAKQVCDSAPLPFFMGVDTANRGGELEAIVVSFLLDGRPVHRFYSFDRPLATTAPELAASVFTVIKALQADGAVFGGLSTDAASAMVGVRAGLSVQLGDLVGHVMRHDTCEFHASARILACLDSLWPPVMNVPSVTQFVYVTWYLLNDDWELYRGRLITFLESTSLPALLDRFGCGTVVEQRKHAIENLQKPLKPNTMRWSTLSDIITFTASYLEALRAAFEEERVNAGTSAPKGSIAAICAQWIRWSGSSKLLSLLRLACDFVMSIWEPANNQIDLRDTDYNVDSCFKVFSRPRRTLEFLLVVETKLANPTTMSSFAQVVGAFGEKRRDEVHQLYKHLFGLVHASVLRNSGRYLSGIYLFAGFADPLFAPIVFEAFSHWKRLCGAPPKRTLAGQRLERELAANSENDEWLASLLTKKSWKQIRALMDTLKRGKSEFVAAIQAASPENDILFTLRSWLAALSHTRPVEKIFLDHDHQSRAEGQTKKKSAEASGKITAPDLREAKVSVANHLNKVQRDLLNHVKPTKKKARLEATEDIAASVALEFEACLLTDEEVSAGRDQVVKRQEYVRQPYKGLSLHISGVFEALLCDIPGWKGPQVQLARLLALGEDIDIALVTTCSAACLRLEKSSKKGSHGSIVTCATCLRIFHRKCMVNEGRIPAGVTKKNLVQLHFVCGQCNQVEQVDHVPHDSIGAEEPIAAREMEPADGERHGKGQKSSKRAKQKINKRKTH